MDLDEAERACRDGSISIIEILALLAMARRTATIEPHLATLRDMHRRAELELAGAERDERLGMLSADTVEWYRQRAAALRAVLGEPT